MAAERVSISNLRTKTHHYLQFINVDLFAPNRLLSYTIKDKSHETESKITGGRYLTLIGGLSDTVHWFI